VLAAFLIILIRLHGGNGEAVQLNQAGFSTGTISSLELTGAQDFDQVYYVNEVEGKIYRLVFCAGVSRDVIVIGIPVTVRYDKIEDGVMYSCSVPMRNEDQQGPQHQRRALLGESITTPLEPRVLIYITTFCGYNQPAAATAESIVDLFYVGNNTWGNRDI
ncbi:hypothetical protein VaNZ11_008697, partial [Volvox africanus]